MNGMDRISPLSDSILHHIFSFLNIKSVIQTCVLSKRWKTLWIDIPTLNFDFDSYPFEAASTDDDDYINSKYSSIKRFILRVFSHHRCKSIQKLTYSSSIHTHEAGFVVELLLCYARHYPVQELCIDTFDALYFECPLDLLEFSSLTVLRMTSCFVVQEWEELQFSRLRILEVNFAWESWVYASNFKKFKVYWDCPCLESLGLVDCVFGSFHISAPQLETFVFLVSPEWELSFPKLKLLTPKLNGVMLRHVLPTVKSDSEFSCIHDVIIEDYGDGLAAQNLTEKFSHLLKVFHNARSFTLPLKSMEVLLSIPPSLSGFCFHNLKHLRLKTEAANNLISLPISTLMSSFKCPNLEMLEVDLNQGVSQCKDEVEQKIALLVEENELRRQEDIMRYQKREEDHAKIDKLQATITQLFNQQEGSQAES